MFPSYHPWLLGETITRDKLDPMAFIGEYGTGNVIDLRSLGTQLWGFLNVSPVDEG